MPDIFLQMWCEGEFQYITDEEDKACRKDNELSPHESPLARWADIVNDMASEELESRNGPKPR